MTNSNTKVIEEMRKLISEGKPLDIDTRDRLLFTAIADVYEQLEEFKPALVFYKVGLFFASGIGVAIIGFIGALLTGNIEITFK